MDKEYTLIDKVKTLASRVFEGIQSQLYNKENYLSFDEMVSQLSSEESHLQVMKGGGDNSAYIVTYSRESTSTPKQSDPPMSSSNRVKTNENIWCN